MTKKHVELLAWMLIGMYVRITFSSGAMPPWLNLGIQLAGLIVFWVSAYKLTNDK